MVWRKKLQKSEQIDEPIQKIGHHPEIKRILWAHKLQQGVEVVSHVTVSFVMRATNSIESISFRKIIGNNLGRSTIK